MTTQSDSVNSTQTSLGGPKKRGRPSKKREHLGSSSASGFASTPPGHSNDSVQLAARATAISSNASWGGARKLQSLELDNALLMHMQCNTERNASRFLNDQISLIPVNPSALGHLSPFEPLADCFISAKIQWQSNVLGSVRYLFRILLIGDIAITIYGKRCNIRDEQLNELRDFCCGKYEKMSDKEKSCVGLVGKEEPTEVLLMNLKTVVKRGTRLVWFCSKFGTGSLFWLHSLFTDNL